MTKFTLSFNAGCRCSERTKTIEVDDEILEGMSDSEVNEYIYINHYKDWVANLIDENIERVR